ncbi:MAG: YihY/virulence factor BrkB family protein [Bacteroidetes bacterium]|nr:YihY/virulence factor BrkB family protein [Bacteroidota bacterium]
MKKLFLNISDHISGVGHLLRLKLSRIVLPGFDGVPLYDVLVFFMRGLFKGVLSYRASAIAYNFFLALIPLILFLFTLIPYVTSENIQGTLLDLMDQIIPASVFEMVKPTIIEIVSRPQSGLLSLGFIMAVYFATNGIDAILEGFNQSYHRIETWSFLRQKLMAFLLMLLISFLVLTAMLLITSGNYIISSLDQWFQVSGSFIKIILVIVQWLITSGSILLSVSLLYFFGQKKDKTRRYRFFSAGSTLSTILFILGGYFLKLYFENFSNYNVLFGSLGSLILLMVWLFYNSFIILIGFELDASIRRSKTIAEARFRQIS